MSLMTWTAFSQQLPDPHFEEWKGATFDGYEQPTYWHYSNVTQVGMNFNFAHKEQGRSGNCVMVQTQSVGAMGINETTPGYVTLGTPWIYLESVDKVNEATAGTDGGISFKYRPDTMSVWVKRTGGNEAKEDFVVLFYSWYGTSKGTNYKGKDGSTCTSTGEHTNEESDIRQAMDANACKSTQFATQVAEGIWRERKAYGSWTNLRIPIYYFNDKAPEKANVILSTSQYPNFRISTGLFLGNSLYVDDIELIYSAKIQKLYINNREWKGFDPNSTAEQIYSLGQGATAMPDIFAVRGAGSLTNGKGAKVTFPGRRLSDSECTITKGAVDGAPTKITVKSEDGKSSMTYTIKFVSSASNNARLADIKVNGQTISGFNAYLTNYAISLPYGTTETPVVSATAQDASAKVEITQASSPTGTATIEVTAGDGTQQTYTLTFSVAALTDATLSAIYADGELLPGYVPTKSNYTLSLPLGTTQTPQITWQSAYPAGVQKVTLTKNSLEEGAQVNVSIPGGTATKTYKITYKIEPSSYSLLAGIALDGVPLAGFEPEKTAYAITLPMGTTSLPVITWTLGDKYQTVKLTEGGTDGVTRIEVTAASGAVTTYRLTFRTEKSTNNALAGIALNGEPLAEFQPDIQTYALTLPAGTQKLPTVSYTQGDAYQTVTVSTNMAQLTIRVTVTAGDGSKRVYVLTFEIEKSANALLQMIYLNGTELAGFVPEQSDYTVVWTEPTAPRITVQGTEGQRIALSTPALYGVARIVVTPEDGDPNTYTVRICSPDEAVLPPVPEDAFSPSDNASLAGLYIDGVKVEDFRADRYDYTYALPWRTYQVPSMLPVAATTGQTITVAYGAVNRPSVITVLAPDKKTQQTYTVLFTAPKSSNTALASVEIDGVENFEFDPSVRTYTDLLLPYGTTQSPMLTVERAEPEQALTITEAPIGSPSTIVVTAEDGSTRTYSFSYRIDYPAKTNELLGIVVDGVGALNMAQAPNFTIDLPYGTQTMTVVSVTKNYPEQEVFILNGGVKEPTTIRVKSLNPAEAEKVYTLTPNVERKDPAMLKDITVDGISLPQFQPDLYNYIVTLPSNAVKAPKVKGILQNGKEAESDENEKFVLLTTETEDSLYVHTYTVTFFYPGDMNFDLDFENWSGTVPSGWYAPANAVIEGEGGYTDQGTTAPETSVVLNGTRSARLSTAALTKTDEVVPGFISLSAPTITIGSSGFLGYGATSSRLSFGDPHLFRNTPDSVYLSYNYKTHTKDANGWRFLYTVNGEDRISVAENFAKLTSGKWYTVARNLSYDSQFVPTYLNILISAAPHDNLGKFDKNSTSTMYVDRLRFVFRSNLKALKVNGKNATINKSTKRITVTLDADDYGMPHLEFTHSVADQMPVVIWDNDGQEGTGRKRTATIRNYAEDGSYTDYALTVTRGAGKSATTACTWTLDGRDLTVVKGSPYQTIKVTANDTAYVIAVKAENGTRDTLYAAWETPAGASRVTTVPAVNPVTGVSTARLEELTGEPVLRYSREYALDSIAMLVTDTCYAIHVFGTNADTLYTIDRFPSRNALLESMTLNEKALAGFDEMTYDYVVSLASLDKFSAAAQDSAAEVRYAYVPVDDETTAVFVQVTAADGVTQAQYSVLVRVHTLATEAYLHAITADGAALEHFQPERYDYTLSLPAHSSIPSLEAVVCDGASVQIENRTVGSSAVVTFTVTAEDGQATHTYTVNVNVAPSDICSLSGLSVGDNELTEFRADRLTYTVELPYGTKELPELYPVKTDRNSTVALSVNGMTVTITVTAEDGVHTTAYVITFTIAKSNNADLKAIYLDGEALTDFYADEYSYTVTLPYGAPLPEITAETADSTATYLVTNGTITVTAGDGVTTHTYTVTFVYAPSTNALLKAIELDGVLQAGFAPDCFEYLDTVAYGSPMPVVTWQTGDEQQQVDTLWEGDTQLTITVTAGDETTSSEYVLTFLHQLSSNWHLSDLQIRGTTIAQFHRDSTAYTLVYPIGTDSASLLSETDVTAVPEHSEAKVSVTKENEMVQIFVTAQDGTVGVYTIDQVVTLSSDARLKMIWLDSVELRAFHPDTLSYTMMLAPGSKIPDITAETMDTLSTWEAGRETETEDGGKIVEIYCEAQDGTLLTYTLQFRFADWIATSEPDTDDYLFTYVGDGQYKAVTIGVSVQFAVYDRDGKRLLLEPVPTADPNDVEVRIEANGNQHLISASPQAEGVLFRAVAGEPYFYVFFDSKNHHVAKGGKFMWVY